MLVRKFRRGAGGEAHCCVLACMHRLRTTLSGNFEARQQREHAAMAAQRRTTQTTRLKRFESQTPYAKFQQYTDIRQFY